MFRPVSGTRFEPSDTARGAWDPTILHGAAAAALLARRLLTEGTTIARLSIEFLAAIPHGPVEVAVEDPVGGRRVQRRDARLMLDDSRVVVSATALCVTHSDLDLPSGTARHSSPFDAAQVPPLDTPNRAAAKVVGHDGFDTHAVIVHRHRDPEDRRLHHWIKLAVPVVEGTRVHPIETAVVAADYAQGAVFQQLPFSDWKFRNAEQTLHLARPPVGDWVGARYEAVIEPVGTGFNSADLFDADGRFAQTAASLVVEARALTPDTGTDGGPQRCT